MVKNTNLVNEYLDEYIKILKEDSEFITISEKINDIAIHSTEIIHTYHFYDKWYISLLRQCIYEVKYKKYITINSFNDIEYRKIVANMLIYDINKKFNKNGFLR